MRNLEVISVTIQKLWPMLKVFVDKRRYRQTGQKKYAHALTIQMVNSILLEENIFAKPTSFSDNILAQHESLLVSTNLAMEFNAALCNS